jgi:hypothetical protein
LRHWPGVLTSAPPPAHRGIGPVARDLSASKNEAREQQCHTRQSTNVMADTYECAAGYASLLKRAGVKSVMRRGCSGTAIDVWNNVFIHGTHLGYIHCGVRETVQDDALLRWPCVEAKILAMVKTTPLITVSCMPVPTKESRPIGTFSKSDIDANAIFSVKSRIVA